ncbi:MAG: metallophosphoesterase [Myxococcota bacterium]
MSRRGSLALRAYGALVATTCVACGETAECADAVELSSGAVLRFAALGDTGTGNARQQQVAAALAATCARDGCDFVLLLGDNFYDHGVGGVDDPQWSSKFEGPYASVPAPFFAVLGNHDYGGGGAGLDDARGQAQVDYAERSARWNMPGRCYALRTPVATLVGLDTNRVLWERPGALRGQGSYAARELERPGWRIAFGHHPYRSNGTHGHAGAYQGRRWPAMASGDSVRTLFEQYLCGRLDLYLSGHDHSRQVLPPSDHCDATLVVTGAGARTTALPGDGPMLFGAATLGFVYVTVSSDRLTVQTMDASGQVDFETDVMRAGSAAASWPQAL